MKKYYKVFGFVFAIAVSCLIFVFRDAFVNLRGYGLFGLFLLSIIGNATIILPTPLFFTAFIAGGVLNPLPVALVVSFGAAIGELTGYLLGFGSKEIIEKDINLIRAKKWLDKYGLWAIFALAAIPNPVLDLAGIVAGATGMPVKKYLIVVWLGKFVKFGLIALLGAGSFSFIGKYF